MADVNDNPVRLARLRAGLTIVEVAAQSGMSLATLWAAERGVLTQRTAERLGKVLGVAPGRLQTQPR